MIDDRQVVDVDENKLLAALSYVGVLVLAPLLMGRNNSFVRWHAKQGLVILIGMVVALMAAAWMPVVGNVLFLVLLIVSVIGLVQALLGRSWRIPIIGQIADSFKI
ncbi:MAG: hypothetical protein ABIH36_04370 [bacterium]